MLPPYPAFKVPYLPLVPLDSLSGSHLNACRTDRFLVRWDANAPLTTKISVVAYRIFSILKLNLLISLDLIFWFGWTVSFSYKNKARENFLQLIAFVTLPILSLALIKGLFPAIDSQNMRPPDPQNMRPVDRLLQFIESEDVERVKQHFEMNSNIDLETGTVYPLSSLIVHPENEFSERTKAIALILIRQGAIYDSKEIALQSLYANRLVAMMDDPAIPDKYLYLASHLGSARALEEESEIKGQAESSENRLHASSNLSIQVFKAAEEACRFHQRYHPVDWTANFKRIARRLQAFSALSKEFEVAQNQALKDKAFLMNAMPGGDSIPPVVLQIICSYDPGISQVRA